MSKTLKTLVIGAGDRGNAWIQHAKTSGADISAVAVAEPDKDKRNQYAEKHNISSDSVFPTGEEALDSGNSYDAVIIATPDQTHRYLAVFALEKGNNVLLEKPMATTEQDCRDIIEAQKRAGTVLTIGHVLRYSDFFKGLKDFVDKKEFGKLIDIDVTEEVANWHFAHGYVRGNWKDAKKSSPIILAKSCHDLDIISWLANSNIQSVMSQGSLRFFTPRNVPQGAKSRCTDGCEVDCVYDARRFYLGDHTTTKDGAVRWPYSTISADTSEEGRKRAIKTTDYGKCVFMSDNDQCDNQDVSMEFKNGVRANFRLRAFGNLSDRDVKLYFEQGEVSGNLLSGKIRIQRYHGIRDLQDITETNIKSMNAHGGGDPYLIKNFADMIRDPNPEKNQTSAELSLQSHLIAFAAEKSRISGKKVTF